MYEHTNIQQGTPLYRGQGKLDDAPKDIGFYALDESVGKSYAIIRGHLVHFKASRPLRLFVMNAKNLERLYAHSENDERLLTAMRAVTGIGLRVGQKYKRHAPWGIKRVLGTSLTTYAHTGAWRFVRKMTPLKKISTRLPLHMLVSPFDSYRKVPGSKLQVYTEGHISKENERTGMYAAKRFACEMKRVLKPLGYDGWTYKQKDAVRALQPLGLIAGVVSTSILGFFHALLSVVKNAFHAEVMLWDSPSKLTQIAKNVPKNNQTLSSPALVVKRSQQKMRI